MKFAPPEKEQDSILQKITELLSENEARHNTLMAIGHLYSEGKVEVSFNESGEPIAKIKVDEIKLGEGKSTLPTTARTIGFRSTNKLN